MSGVTRPQLNANSNTNDHPTPESIFVMRPLQLAVASRCIQRPWRDAFKLIAASPATGIQFDLRDEVTAVGLGETARREFLHRLEEHGLKTAASYFSMRSALTEPDRLDAKMAAIRAAMEFAYSLRSTVLCLRVGTVPAADSPELTLLRELLGDLARHGNHVGVTLAITPMQDSPERLRGLLDSIKTGPIGVDFDPAGFAMTGQSAADALRSLHDLIVHLQIRDGRRELGGPGAETAVGRGEVDWVEILPLLQQIDFKGWLTAIRTQGNDPGSDVLRAVTYINTVQMGG